MKKHHFKRGILNRFVLGFAVISILTACVSVSFANVVFTEDFEAAALGKIWLINYKQQEAGDGKPIWIQENGVLKQTNPQPGDPTYAIITGLDVPDHFGIQAMVRIDAWQDHGRSRAGLGIWLDEKNYYNGYTWLIHQRLDTKNMEFLNDHRAWFQQEATFPIELGKWYWMKLFIDDTNIYGKIWAVGNQEPADWLSEKPYGKVGGKRSPTKLVGLNGGAGLRTQGGHSTVSFDNVLVFDDINDYDLEAAIAETPAPVDTTPPTVTTASPADGDKDLNPDTLNTDGIVISFSETIDTQKIQISIKTGDQTLTWQPAWSDGDKVLTLTPTAGNALDFETKYSAILSQVTDTAGNAAPDVAISFVTKAAPAEVSLPTLRAAYLFDEGSGTTALDQTGAFNGTIVGATYSTNAPHGEAGNFSLLFDGNARVELGPSSNFAFSSISVELFVNPTAIKGGQRSGFNRANYALAIGQGSSNVGLLLGIDGDGQSGQVGDGTNTSYFDLFNPTPPIPLNAWTHLALTFDGSTNTGRLYVNGSLVASVQQKAITYNENLPARIGALSDRFPGAAWVGFIDEVKIYEGVRTEEEIASSARGVPKPLSLSFPLSLKKGLNMISLPLEPQTPFTAKSLATALGATVVIRHDTDQGRFIPYIPTLAERTGGQGFPIEGGMGYIVNVLEDKEFAFTGQPWGEPVFQAPPIAERNTDVSRSVWAFVVSGLLSRTGSLPVQSMPASVQVTNLRSGVTVRTTPEGEVFQVALVDLNRAPVVLPGDTLEVVALDANGERVSGPFRLEVQTPHLRVAYLHTQMRIGDVIPEQTRLLANYPNPFNPETWVPYELAEAADVTLEIYNLSGRLVRRLHVGQKPAGVYTDRSRAIHWDGRNDIGERVTSGLYFYHFHAGEYEAVRRMVILK